MKSKDHRSLPYLLAVQGIIVYYLTNGIASTSRGTFLTPPALGMEARRAKTPEEAEFTTARPVGERPEARVSVWVGYSSKTIRDCSKTIRDS